MRVLHHVCWRCFAQVPVLALAACSGGGSSSGNASGPIPTADAGISRGVTVHEATLLDGSRSTTIGGARLAFTWRLETKPAASLATLAAGQTAHPTLRPDVAGDYVVSLVVTARGKASQPSRVTIAADQGADLRVGPGRSLTRPSEAASVARDGDSITIDATTYDGDAAIWRASDLTIRGAGGRAHLRARGADAQGKGTWVVKGDNTTIEGIEFSGASVKDQNGAGIRGEGSGLTLRRCYFHDNEDGILIAAHPTSDVLIEHCEFARNGRGDGRTHNLYVNEVRSLTVRYCYSHHTRIGHLIKSRAATNTIAYNRIMDEADGTSSYAIDLPNGGLSFVIGNQVQQGPFGDNQTMVSYGAEGLTHADNRLFVVSNTFVNDRARDGTFVFVRSGGTAVLTNNVFAGPGSLLIGPGSLTSNLALDPGFVDRSTYDYHLARGSGAIDAATDAGSVGSVSLTPTFEYRHVAGKTARPRHRTLDIGAFEFDG